MVWAEVIVTEDVLRKMYDILNMSPRKIIRNKLDEIGKILEEISAKRGNPIFAILYSQYSPIQREHVDKVFSKFKGVISQIEIQNLNEIDIVVHTLGGDADAAFHLGYVIQKYVEELESKAQGKTIKINIIVPRIAKSAGTLFSLCGDKIILTRVSELGPIDPQIRSERGAYVSAKTMRDSLKQVLEIVTELSNERKRGSKENIRRAIENLLYRIPVTEMGHYESLIRHVSKLAEELLSHRMFRDEGKGGKINIGNIVANLVRGYEYHGYVLTYWHLKNMGLRCELASEELEEKLLAIYRKFEEIERIISIHLVPPILSLPEFISQYMHVIHEFKNGVAILPTSPPEVDEILSRILEIIEGAERFTSVDRSSATPSR